MQGMHYYIDGYNLLFRSLHAKDNLKTQRQELIHYLETRCQFLNLDITVVFDSQYQPDDGSRSHYSCLEICFTAEGETADDYILQELKESLTPSEETVVTSDKKLAWRCRRRLAKTESVEEFITWLNKRYKNKLKQLKEEAEKIKAPKTPEPPPPQKLPPKSPKKGDSPESCFQFYLESFEANTQLIAPPSSPKSSTPSINAKKKKAPKPPEDPLISDMERWLRAFENDSGKGS